MQGLALIRGYDPIFRKYAEPVDKVDFEIREIITQMFMILYDAGGIGLGANMVGLLKRIAVIDLMPEGQRNPIALINPEITWWAEKTQTFTEASLCFPGISAEITRPSAIRVQYLDKQGDAQVMEADGWLAQVIQHEVDYLDGMLFVDHLSRVKRDMLMRKIKKIR